MPAGLSPGARDRLAKAVRERLLPKLSDDPERAQSKAAEKLGINQSTISRLLDKSGARGGSQSLVEAVARLLNEPPGMIMWGTRDGSEPVVLQLRDLPGFQEAMSAAIARSATEHPGITRQALEYAADTRIVPAPARVTAGLLIHMALAAREAVPPLKSRHSRARRRT